MLDARPMKGSKRVPILNVEANGGAVIELWCNTVKARIEVAGNTFSVTAGSRSEQQCAPERLRADDELIDALLAITSWQRAGDVLTLRGTKTLRFRTPTH
jgi:heat shock protein HslJ